MTELLLLPGTLCTEAAFAVQKRHLAEVANCHILPLRAGRTIAEMAAWVLAQAPARFALAGFSQGALVALALMRQAPERVSRLCLMACNPRGSTEGQLATWRRWQQQAQAEGLATLSASFADNVHPERRNDAQLRQLIVEMAQATGVETFIAQLEALISRIDSRPYLGEIRCPTLLMVGEADRLTPLYFHEEARALIPTATLAVVPECGHYLPLEQPVAVSALLRYWLAN